MRAFVAIAAFAVACGGKAPPPPAPPAPPPPPVAKRVPVDDTEPEDGVTVINGHGHMEQATVEAALAPHNDALSACYMSRVGRRRWLGGHVVVHWDVTKEGMVSSVKLAESDLGAHAIEKCLVDVARGVDLGKPIGGDAEVTIPLDFSAKGATLPWDEDKALKAVGGQLARLEMCDKKSGAPNDVTITVYVGPHGKAQSVGFASAKTEIADKWAECAEKAALAWRLPDPRGTIAKLAVRYRAST